MDKQEVIFAVVTYTLAAVIVAVVVVLLFGLFSPRVDNKEIFAIIGPAFHTVVGVFVGILSARYMARRPDDRP